MSSSSGPADDVRVPLLMVEGVEVPDERPSSRGQSTSSRHAVGPAAAAAAAAGADDEDKYPPLPPSYNDVLRADLNRRSGWQTLKEHVGALHQCVPAGLREDVRHRLHATRATLLRLWPTSRFSHVMLVLTGLWVLFVLTGPGMSDEPGADGGFWNWEDIEPYETLPQPLPGDGHVRQPANWTMKGCALEKVANSWSSCLYCTASTEFELTVPPSFGAGDHLYVLVDPPHEGKLPAEDKRGSAYGTIRFVEDPVDRGVPEDLHATVKVIVQAKYDKMKERYFRGANVVKLGSNSFHQGVSVYTRPVPGKHAVEWDITVLIPKHVPIPMFDVKTGSMHVSLFDGLGPSVPVPVPNAEAAAGANGEAQGTPRALAKRHFDNIHMDKSTQTHFGALNIQTGTGHVAIGWDLDRPLETAGLLTIGTRTGDVLVGGNVHAHMLDISTNTGALRVGPNMGLEAWREATIRTKAGRVELNPGSYLRATTLEVSTEAGGITALSSPETASGKIYANHTVTLNVGAGAIGPLPIEVQKPYLYGFRPSETFVKTVAVTAQTKAGHVGLAFLPRPDMVPVQIDAGSKAGNVQVQLDNNFVGSVDVSGRKGTKALAIPSIGTGKGQLPAQRTWNYSQKAVAGKVNITGTLAREGTHEIAAQSFVKLSTVAGKSTLDFDN